MTNHVVSAKPAGPAGRGNSAALDAFIARHGLPALDAPVPTGPALEREVDALERALAELDREDRRGAHPLAKAGARLPGPRGRRARPEDATLPCLDGPCLDGPAGMTAAAGPGVAALPRR